MQNNVAKHSSKHQSMDSSLNAYKKQKTSFPNTELPKQRIPDANQIYFEKDLNVMLKGII